MTVIKVLSVRERSGSVPEAHALHLPVPECRRALIPICPGARVGVARSPPTGSCPVSSSAAVLRAVTPPLPTTSIPIVVFHPIAPLDPRPSNASRSLLILGIVHENRALVGSRSIVIPSLPACDRRPPDILKPTLRHSNSSRTYLDS
jgi:hypothetical protein